MYRIVDHAKALHSGSSWNVDSTLRNEFGWGSHTAHTAIVTYGRLHSHATVYVSEDKIIIILSADPDYGTSYNDARNEDEFAIELADVKDVLIKREVSFTGKLHKLKKEVFRQSVFIFLSDNQGSCALNMPFSLFDSSLSSSCPILSRLQTGNSLRCRYLRHRL
jgi:hypothetical protein